MLLGHSSEITWEGIETCDIDVESDYLEVARSWLPPADPWQAKLKILGFDVVNEAFVAVMRSNSQ